MKDLSLERAFLSCLVLVPCYWPFKVFRDCEGFCKLSPDFAAVPSLCPGDCTATLFPDALVRLCSAFFRFTFPYAILLSVRSFFLSATVHFFVFLSRSELLAGWGPLSLNRAPGRGPGGLPRPPPAAFKFQCHVTYAPLRLLLSSPCSMRTRLPFATFSSPPRAPYSPLSAPRFCDLTAVSLYSAQTCSFSLVTRRCV